MHICILDYLLSALITAGQIEVYCYPSAFQHSPCYNSSFNYILGCFHIIIIFNRLAPSIMYICNAQCDAQNTKCHINTSAHMQPPFKFWSSANHNRHLILAPKGYICGFHDFPSAVEKDDNHSVPDCPDIITISVMS